MARGSVWVLPGMFPATVIVAPNSLRARTKPSSRPARMPRYASGTVIVAATRSGPAPRLLADISSRSSTSPIATMIARAMSGNETTADAIAAATQVNTISTPRMPSSSPPTGPSRPSSSSRKRPTATGGRASGSDTTASIRMRPGTRRLTTSQLTASASGTLISVATTATWSVSSIGCRSTTSVYSVPAPPVVRKPCRSNMPRAASDFRNRRNPMAASRLSEPSRTAAG